MTESDYGEGWGVTVLDTHTGRTAIDVGESGYYWAEANGSCDCNREILFGLDNSSGTCLNCERFLIIAHNYPNYTLNQMNSDYPKELISEHIEMSEDQKLKKWRDAITAKTMDFDRCIELAPLRAQLIEHDNTQSNGGCLHIVTEDGNYDDDSIKYCIGSIESGRWKEHWSKWVSEEAAANQLDIAKQLLELTEWEREMVNGGNTMNEDVFVFLMNGDTSGLLEEDNAN